MKSDNAGQTTEKEIEAIRRYLSQQEDILLAIVFGSLATGKAGRQSDLDIAIQKKQALTAEEKIELISQLALITGRSIDLIDLSTAGEPVLGQILKYGRRILGSDQVFAEIALKNIYAQADFMPYIERTMRERRRQWLDN